jgi:hypothetical protein
LYRGIYYDIHTCVYRVSLLDSPLRHSPTSPFLPFLEQFEQVLFFYFYIWIQNTSSIFTLIHSFLSPSLLLLVLTPGKYLFVLPFCPSFF